MEQTVDVTALGRKRLRTYIDFIDESKPSGAIHPTPQRRHHGLRAPAQGSYTMLSKHILTVATATIALLGAAAAFAQETTPTPEIDHAVSTTTRAEVRSQTAEALRQGLIPRNDYEEQLQAERTFLPTKTRTQVVAETIEARRLGLLSQPEGSQREATAAELDAIQRAGLRAAENTSVAARR
jgi:Domain of unknown function (DUF4148)